MSAPLPDLPPLDDGVLDVDSLLSQVHEQTDADDVHDQILSLPSPWRIALALLTVGGISVSSFLIAGGVRGDLEQEAALLRLAVPMILAAVGAGAAAVLSLRGPDKPPIRHGGWLIGGALLSPLLLSFIPVPGMDTHGAVQPMIGCFSMGGVAALATAGGILLFSRWVRKDRNTLALAASAGGLVGLIIQQMHCAANDLTHLILAHGFLALVVGGLFGIGSLLRRR